MGLPELRMWTPTSRLRLSLVAVSAGTQIAVLVEVVVGPLSQQGLGPFPPQQTLLLEFLTGGSALSALLLVASFWRSPDPSRNLPVLAGFLALMVGGIVGYGGLPSIALPGAEVFVWGLVASLGWIVSGWLRNRSASHNAGSRSEDSL